MNPEFHAQLKHINVQYHYIRELVENNTVKLEYIQTSEIAADYLTKPLKRVQYQVNLSMLGIVEG
jgi:hypothetical protein